MTHVTVLGSVNLDLVVAVPHLPEPGETILGSDLVYRAGGKGGNQAVAARRLGARTTLVAATGDDQLGADLRSMLGNEGLDMSMVTTAMGTTTGVALVVVAEDGENSIVVAPGANRTLRPGQVPDLPVVLEDTDVLVLQVEVPVGASLDAAIHARAAGAKVLLNAAPLPELPDAEFDKLLGAVDVLVVNEGEALQLTNSTVPAARDGWEAIAAEICRLGPGSAVITLGADGAVASDGTRTYVQPAFPVNVVDTTGAGDGFSGALAVAVAERRSLVDGLRRACAAGALATTALGAQSALPSAAELDRLLGGLAEGGDGRA